MSYYTATGDVTAASFSTTSTLCKPKDLAARYAAEGLQRQLNRVAYAMKWPLIVVDGEIGRATVALANKIGDAWLVSKLGAFTCTSLVGDIARWTAKFQTAADEKGAPAVLPAVPPPASVPSISPGGAALLPPPQGGGLMGWLGRRSMIEKIGLGVGGVAAVMLIGTMIPGAPGGRARGRR